MTLGAQSDLDDATGALAHGGAGLVRAVCSSSTIAAASAGGSAGGTTRPASARLTSSEVPVVEVTMQGAPQPIASSVELG